MRVCLFNASVLNHIGGIETDVIELSNALAEKGVNVTIVVGSGKQFQKVNPKVRIFTYPFIQRNSLANKILTKITPEVITEFQIEEVSFILTSWIHFLFHDYDVIHFHQSVDSILFNFLRRFKKFKTVLTVHGYPTNILIGQLKKIDAIISVSKKVEEHFTRKGIESRLIYNCVNEKKFFPEKKEKKLVEEFNLENKFVLMSAGRIEEWKGLQFIVKALNLIKEKNPDVVLLIVGDGSYTKELIQLIQGLGVEEKVKFAGRFPNEKIRSLINCCDVFLQPSIGWEAFSNSILEAMACGKPVIASNIGGNPEIIENGFDGFLVPAGDERALAGKIIELKKNNRKRVLFGVRARNKIKNNFTWGIQVKKILQAYLSEE